MKELLKEFKFAKSFYDDCILFGKRTEHLEQIDRVLTLFGMGFFMYAKGMGGVKITPPP